MKYMNKRIAASIALATVLFSGCGQTAPESSSTPTPIRTATPIPTPTPESTIESIPEPTPEPTPDLTNMSVNLLTGLYIDKAIAARRPVAIVINNLPKALPQSGIGQASMYYEVLSEGSITRIISIFQDFDTAKIGPIRSMRHYFLDFALDHDAIFAHHGHSPQGKSALRSLGIDNIEGLNVDGTYYWRDAVRKNTPGMFEHSSYTSAENLWKYINDKARYRTDKAENYEGMFAFYDTATAPIDGIAATKITVKFTNAFKPVFTYNPETNLYAREQYNGPHIDELTGNQLMVTNILVQNTSVRQIVGDREGRRDVTLVGSGTGMLFTQGTAMSVTWKKTSHQSPTEWFDAQGNKLTLNAGKTWVCVTSETPAFD